MQPRRNIIVTPTEDGYRVSIDSDHYTVDLTPHQQTDLGLDFIQKAQARRRHADVKQSALPLAAGGK